jgi:predicted metalloprotease
MRLDDERESQNVEDRRGQGGGGGGFSGGRIAGGGLGMVAVVLIAMFLGVDPGQLIQALDGGGAPPPQQQSRAPDTGNDANARFVSRVLASTEDVWTAEFRRMGKQYEVPRLVLFTGATQSGCGAAQSAMGPFYCPNDRRVYIDMAFFREMERRLGAPGDFARAYVIAHEVGHHVQNLLGVLPRAQQAQAQAGGEARANAISVRVELMADCLAGFWARRADEMRRMLDAGDIDEGINAAAAVGDDRLQGSSAHQEHFTHGTSAQRTRWFRTGLQANGVDGCDTFQRD